jgi:hypothetical protein
MQFKTPAFASSHRLHLLAGACLSLCSALAQAATPTQAELDSIVLYGNTTIAQDSTSAWGIWDSIEPTSAGPALPRTEHFTTGDVYRPLAQWTVSGNQAAAAQADSICKGGGICGFGIFYDGYDYGGYMYTPVNVESVSEPGNMAPTLPSHHPYALTADVVAAPVQEVVSPFPMPFPMPFPILLQPAAVTSDAYPAALEVLSAPLLDGSFMLPGKQTLVGQGKGYYSKQNQVKGDENYSLRVDRWANDYFNPAEVQATWYYGDLYKYVSGTEDGEGGWQVHQGVEGVAGVVTADADMSALRASNVTATYVGFDGKGETYKANVKLDVNFGNGSFTGAFNGGTDGGYVAKVNTPNGTQLTGQVGFAVTSGVITGANFKSTGLSAADGTVKGTVTGAFFGPMAAAAGGVADVTKTRNDGAYQNARFTSPFLAIKGLDANTVRSSRD